MRAIALFIAEARPLRAGSDESNTVVVRGAMKNAAPIPSSTTAGKYVVQYVPPMPGSAKSTNAQPATAAPIVSGVRAPIFATRPPDQRESPNCSSTNGRKAAPAAVGAYRCTSIGVYGKKYRLPPNAR
jgi:hypothetical protein